MDDPTGTLGLSVPCRGPQVGGGASQADRSPTNKADGQRITKVVRTPPSVPPAPETAHSSADGSVDPVPTRLPYTRPVTPPPFSSGPQWTPPSELEGVVSLPTLGIGVGSHPGRFDPSNSKSVRPRWSSTPCPRRWVRGVRGYTGGDGPYGLPYRSECSPYLSSNSHRSRAHVPGGWSGPRCGPGSCRRWWSGIRSNYSTWTPSVRPSPTGSR